MGWRAIGLVSKLHFSGVFFFVEGTPLKNIRLLITLGAFSLIATISRADDIVLGAPAKTYAVLGATGVSNTGSSVISGNVGVSPAAATFVTGFFPPVVTLDNADAANAQGVASAFYTSLGGLSATAILPSLDGVTLTPGVYSTGAALLDSGDTLTLNFEGDNNRDIVLLMTSTLTTDSGSSVVVENLGTGDNVYYQVATTATLGSHSVFLGDILASDSVILDPYADITCGSAIALTAAVTLSSNDITNCSSTYSTSSPSSNVIAAAVTPTPEPGAIWLLSSGLLAGAGVLRRRRFAA
jgi:hypothetical protein